MTNIKGHKFPVIRAREDGLATYHGNPIVTYPVTVVTFATINWGRKHRRTWQPHMCCMGDYGSRVSIAFSVWCLIKDYHSPMDAWPRHEAWEGIY